MKENVKKKKEIKSDFKKQIIPYIFNMKILLLCDYCLVTSKSLRK